MQTISVPKECEFVELQLDLNNDCKNNFWVELRFIKRDRSGRWGVVAILPDRTIVGKMNTRPGEPWVIMDVKLNEKVEVNIEVIDDPEDDFMMIMIG